MSTHARLLIAEDDPGAAEALLSAFRGEGYDVALATTGREARERFAEGPWDCVLTDVVMPDVDGLTLLGEFVAASGAPPVIVMTAYGSIERAVQAMKDGAVDFLQKPVNPEELLERTRAALEQGRRTAAARCHEREIRAQISQLTRREREVLSYVCEGGTSKKIAEMLGISLKTIEVHRSRALMKLRAQNVAELVRRVAAAGIRPEELRQ